MSAAVPGLDLARTRASPGVRALVRRIGSVPRVIMLNGPPGCGKSTLARRYVGEHPFTLNLDIDRIRDGLESGTGLRCHRSRRAQCR